MGNLSAALAAPRPTQEPVGYINKTTLENLTDPKWRELRNMPAELWTANEPPSRAIIPVYLHPTPEPTQEPVAWMKHKSYSKFHPAGIWETTVYIERGAYDDVPLYAHPAQPQTPMTDAELEQLAVSDQFLLFCSQDEFNEIARAVERYHGIGK